MAKSGSSHILRVIISCRQLSAEVSAPAAEAILAMASSSEPEFASEMRSRLNTYPRSRTFWDCKVASRVGSELAKRLTQIGVTDVHLLPEEGISWSLHHRRPAAPLFDSLKRAGIIVHGVEAFRDDLNSLRVVLKSLAYSTEMAGLSGYLANLWTVDQYSAPLV